MSEWFLGTTQILFKSPKLCDSNEDAVNDYFPNVFFFLSTCLISWFIICQKTVKMSCSFTESKVTSSYYLFNQQSVICLAKIPQMFCLQHLKCEISYHYRWNIFGFQTVLGNCVESHTNLILCTMLQKGCVVSLRVLKILLKSSPITNS